MNIPLGTVEEEHISFSDSDPFAKLKKLTGSGFAGYLVATIEGISGLEEGVLLIRDQEVVGTVFSALRLNKQLHGVKSLRLVLNLLKAKKGVFDVNKLSKQQIDLIIAFNEKLRLAKPLSLEMLSKLEPKTYAPNLVSKELAVDLSAKDTKYNVLKELEQDEKAEKKAKKISEKKSKKKGKKKGKKK